MSRRKLFIYGIIAFVSVTAFYNSFYPKFLVTGEYVARISNDFGADGIKDGDKLRLNEDGSFQSDCWGTGVYKIEGPRIIFNFRKEGVNTYFNRPLFYGKPRIIIFYDLGSEFIKK